MFSASAPVLVNGSSTNEFSLIVGQKQGGHFSPFSFLLATEGSNILNLQFADDIVIVDEKSWANIRALKANFVLSEVVSGLNVNFNRSLLIGMNVSSSWLIEMAVLVLLHLCVLVY